MQIRSLGESQQCLAQGAPAKDPWLPVAHSYVLVRSGNQHKGWWYTRAEPSFRQGNGHQPLPVCQCVPAMLPQQILFTNRLLDSFCPQIWYFREYVQIVSTRGTGETPGFPQPPAVLHFTHKLVNTRVSMFIQLPLGLGLPAQCLLKAALPNAGLLSGHLRKKGHGSS